MMNLVSVQGVPYLACLVMLGILAYVGIHVLKREIIFIDIALAQIAAVGAIAAHVIFSLHGDSLAAQMVALGTTLGVAAFFAVIRRKVREIPLEAIIGVTYAIAAAAALFLVGIAPGGHVHVQSMLSGSILWATWTDVVTSAAILAVVALCFFVFRKRFQAISDDYEEAAAKGMNTMAWDFFFYALVSIVITTVVRIGGVVVVFSFLIIPVTTATMVARGWTSRLIVSWILGALAAAVGLLFAERFDFSVGPAIALWLGGALVLTGVLRRVHVPQRVSMAATTALLLAALLGVGIGNPTFSRRARHRVDAVKVETREGTRSTATTGGEGSVAADADGHEDVSVSTPVGHGHSLESAAGSEETLDEDQLVRIADPSRLRVLYDRFTGPYERSLVVSRVIEVDAREGLSLALNYLEEDPPPLFRETVLEKLEARIGIDSGYDIGQPFAAALNQAAVARLKKQIKTP